MDNSTEQPKKKRGRPPGPRKTLASSLTPQPQSPLQMAQESIAGQKGRQKRPKASTRTYEDKNKANAAMGGGLVEPNDEELAYALEEEKLSPFSSFLRNILRRDRSEIIRLAGELEVSENTIYRWMNGRTEPQPTRLKQLLEALPEHRGNLTYVINQTFPGILAAPSARIREVQKDIYRRILELVATNDDDDVCFWQVSQALFEYALLHLDTERQGLCIIYAKLMPLQKDGVIHSLREFTMRGSAPWVYTNDVRGYLGGTTLAGYAASYQRSQVWSNAEKNGRLPVEVDEFERSACAAPIVRGSSISGVLIVSSTQPTFFNNPSVCEAVVEYAQLLSIGLREKDFQPVSRLSLRPMPPLSVQREHLTHSYASRTVAHIRKYRTSRQEAERHVQQEMESEFEAMAREARGLPHTMSEQFQRIAAKNPWFSDN